MRATHFSLLLWLSGSSFLVAQSTTPAYPFRDPSLDLEKRVNNVLSLMTVEEKIEMSGCFVDILGECVVCRWEILTILLFVGVVSDILTGQQTS